MSDRQAAFLKQLKESVQDWEEEAKYWEDPRIAALENLSGSRRSAKETAMQCRARAEKLREFLADFTGANQPVSGPVETSRFNEPAA